MRILVFGKNGMVGRDIVSESPDVEIFGPPRDVCNIAISSHVSTVLSSIRPDVVINAAAYTDVDGAERDGYYDAFQVNSNGPFHIAKAIADLKLHAKLVHISSDFVFNGKNAPYDETSEEVPLNTYGMSKLFGDLLTTKLCEESGIKLAIVRTSWVFGGRANFPEAILKKLRTTSESIQVVNDQIGVPTLASDLAKACMELALGERVGLYNFRNSGEPCSRYEWAKHIAETAYGYTSSSQFSPDRIVPCATSDQPARPAKRPLNTTLSIAKYGTTPPWMDASNYHVIKILSEGAL